MESEEPCARHVKDRVDLGLKQQKKELSTKTHEERRRATKKTGRGKRNPPMTRGDAIQVPAFGLGPERKKIFLHGCTGCTGLSSSTPLPRLQVSSVSFRVSQLPLQQPLVLFILCIHVQLVDNRINRTGSLLPIGHEEKRKEIHSYSCLFVFIRGSSFFSD